MSSQPRNTEFGVDGNAPQQPLRGSQNGGGDDDHTQWTSVKTKQRSKRQRLSTNGSCQEIRELYEQFDVNKTDSLSPKELRQGLQLLGLNPTVSDVKAIIKKHCPPKKKVTYEVWERIFKEELLSKTNQEFDLLEAFKIFDTDNSGTLDKGELKRCLTSMGEKLTDEECDELFDQLDKDKNGTLSFLEASKLLA